METIIFAVIIGLGIAFFATQNSSVVTVHLASYVLQNVPLYLVVVGALLLGLLLAWIFYLIRSFSSSLTIYGKENKIKEANKTIAQLAKQIHELELENARLKTEKEETDQDDKSL